MILPCLLVAACAMRNPAPPTTPAAWTPPPPEPAAETATKTATPEGASANAAQDPAAPKPAATSAQPANDVVIATVAGKPIYASELMAQWLYAGRAEAREQLDNLVVNRLVVVEATRLGVMIDPALADQMYERMVATVEKEIQASRKSFESYTLDRYVDQYLGLDPKRYRERMRDDSLRSLLGERVVRGWLLQNEHAFLRVIVVRSEDDKRAVEVDLAAGMAFEEAAKKHSKDGSSANGGLLPPIVRGQGPLASIAFATEPGKVGGPIVQGTDFAFVYVVKRSMPLAGAWDVLGPEVEKSIAEQRVDPLELEQWSRAMRDRYTIDRTPFLRLAGETSR